MADKCVACGEVAEGKPLYKKLGSSDCQVEVYTALHEMQLLSLPPEEKNNHYICWDCDETISEEYSTFISTEAKKKAVEAKRKQQDEARKIKLQKKLKQAFKKVHEDKLKASGETPPVSKYKMKEIKREQNKYYATFCLLCKSEFEESNSRGNLKFNLQKMIDDENDVADVLLKLGLQGEITPEMKPRRFVCCQCYNKIRRNYKALCKGEVSSPLHFPLQENNDELSAFKRRPTADEHAAEIAKMIPPSLANLYKVVTNESPKANSKSKADSSDGARKSKRSRKKNPKYSSSEYSNSEADSGSDDNLENVVTPNHHSASRNGLKESNYSHNKVKIRIKNSGYELLSKVESPKTPTIRTLLPKGADEFGSHDSDVATPVSFTSRDSEIIDFGQCNMCGLGFNSRPKTFWHKLSHSIPSVAGITVQNALKILDSNLADVNEKVREKELVCKSCFSQVANGFKSQILRKLADKKGVDVTKLGLSKLNVQMFKEEIKKANGAFNNNNIDNRNNNVKKKNKKDSKRSSKSPITDRSNSHMNGFVEETKNSQKKIKSSRKVITDVFSKGEKIYKLQRCSKSFQKTFAALKKDFELINLINESRHLRYKGKVVLLSSVTVELADLKGILAKSVVSSGKPIRLELYKELYQFSNYRRNLKNKDGWDKCIICQKGSLPIENTTRWLEDPVSPPNLMVPLRWAHLTITDTTTNSTVNYATEDGKVCESCHDSLKNKFGKFVGSRVAKSHSLSSEQIVLEKYKVSFDSISMNIVADPLEPSQKESKKKLKNPGRENHSKNKKKEELCVERLPSKTAEKSHQESSDAVHNFVNEDGGQEKGSNYNDSKSHELGSQAAAEKTGDQLNGSKLDAVASGDNIATEAQSGREKHHSEDENRMHSSSYGHGDTFNGFEQAPATSTDPSESDRGLNTTDLNNEDERDQDTLSMDLHLSDTSSDSESNEEDKDISDKKRKNSVSDEAEENHKDLPNISIEKDVESSKKEIPTNASLVLENFDTSKTKSIDEKTVNDMSEKNVTSTECTPVTNKVLSTLSKQDDKSDEDNSSNSLETSESNSPSISVNKPSEVVSNDQPQNGDETHTSDDAARNTSENLNESLSDNEDEVSSPTKDLIDTNPVINDHVKDTNLSTVPDDLIPENNDVDQNCDEKEFMPKKRKSSETAFKDKSTCKKKCLEPNESNIEEKRSSKIVSKCKVNGMSSPLLQSDDSNSQNSESESDDLPITNRAVTTTLTTENNPSEEKESTPNSTLSEDEFTEGSTTCTPEKGTNLSVENEVTQEENSAMFTSGKRKARSDSETNDSAPTFPNLSESIMVGENEEESEFGEDYIAPFAQRKKFMKKNHTNEIRRVSEKEAMQSCVDEIWHTIQGISLDDLICEGIDFPLRLSQFNVGFLLALNDLRGHLGASLEDLIGWTKRLLPMELRVKGFQLSTEKISSYLLSNNNSPKELGSTLLKQALPEELFYVPKSHQIKHNQERRSDIKCYIEDVMEPNDRDVRWEDFLAPVKLDNLLANKPSRVSWSEFNNGLLYALWKVNKMINGDRKNFIHWLSLTSTTVMKDKDYIAMSNAVVAIENHLENYPEEINRLVAPIVVRSVANKTDDICQSKNTNIVDESHCSRDEEKLSSDGDIVIEKVISTSNSSSRQKSNSLKKLARVLPRPLGNTDSNDSTSTSVVINNGHSIFDPHVRDTEGILNLVPPQLNSVPSTSNCQSKFLYNGNQNVSPNNARNGNFVVAYDSNFNRPINQQLNHPVQMFIKVNSPSIANPHQPPTSVFGSVSHSLPTSTGTNQSIQYQTSTQMAMPLLAMRPAYSPAAPPTSVSAAVPMIPVLNPNGLMTMVPLSVRMPVATTAAAMQPRFSNMPIAVQPVTHPSPVQLQQGIPQPHIYPTGIGSFNPPTPTNDGELVSKVNSLEQQLLEMQKQNSQLLEMQKLYQNKLNGTEKDRSDTPSSSGESIPSEISQKSQPSEPSCASSQNKQRKSLRKTDTSGNKNPKVSFEDALNYEV